MHEETFWSIVIEPEWVQAAIWGVEDSQAKVLSVGSPSSWSSEADLITATDTTLSSAIQPVAESVFEPKKTVFGVSPSWVSGGEIGEENLGKIKKLCGKLSLTPSGFVVLPEAIAHFFKSEEGSPLSGVVLGIAEGILDVSLFRLGRLVGSVSVARSVSLFEDVIEGLARFGRDEPLPSRFLIYNLKEGELEEARQILTDADWKAASEKVPFLHTPKIEVVDAQTKLLAVSLAGAAETGQAKTAASLIPKKEPEEKQSFTEEAEDKTDRGTLSVQDVGFRVGQDVVDNPAPPANSHNFNPQEPGLIETKSGFLARVGGFVSGLLPRRLPNFGNLRGRMPLFLGVGALLLLVSFFVAWWFLPRATVIVYVSPQKLESVETLTLSTQASSLSVSDKVIPASEVEVEVSGEKTARTTGVNIIGEKAKGKVTIRNGTDEAIRFPAGTTITSNNDLKFSLDSSASVSAATSPTSPGTAEIEVTAADIGSEYNLAKDESFSVSNYPKSDVDAVAGVDFTGGSSQEIAAVGEDDRQELGEALKDELTDQALSELKAKTTGEVLLVEEAVSVDLTAEDFSADVGDEASELTLEMQVSVSSILVKKEDLAAFTQNKLSSQVPSGFVLRGDQIAIEFDVENENEGEWEVEASFLVNLLPEIKTDEIARDIAGKYRPLAEERLSRVPGFSRAKIEINPQFPGRLGTLPRIAKNISVEVAAEK